MKHLATALLAAALWAAFSWPAAGQELCGERAAFARALAQHHQEAPVAVGVANDGSSLVELFASPGGASWTIMLTLPNGDACVIAAGEDWQRVPIALGPPA